MAATTISMVYGSQLTHVGSGVSLAAGAVGGDTTSYSTPLSSVNTLRYPRADVVLRATFSQSIAAASNTIALYRRDINQDGTFDEAVPNWSTDASNLAKLAGIFVLPAGSITANTHYMTLTDVELNEGQCEFYIKNDLGTPSILVGWTLKITPKTDAAQ